jgi:hypothetical protein
MRILLDQQRDIAELKGSFEGDDFHTKRRPHPIILDARRHPRGTP